MKRLILLMVLMLIPIASATFIQSNGGSGDEYGYFFSTPTLLSTLGETGQNITGQDYTIRDMSCNLFSFNSTLNNSIVRVTYIKTNDRAVIYDTFTEGMQGQQSFSNWLLIIVSVIGAAILVMLVKEMLR